MTTGLLTPNSHQTAKFSQRTYVRYLALSLLQNPHHPSFSHRPLLVLLTPPLLPNLCTNIIPIFFSPGYYSGPPKKNQRQWLCNFFGGKGGGGGRKKPLRRRKRQAIIDEYVYPPHFVPTITGQAACSVDASGSPDLRRLYQKAAVPCQTKL